MKVFIQAIIALGLMKYAYDVSDVTFSEDEIEHRPIPRKKKSKAA